MTNPKESAKEKASSSELQPREKNSPQNAPDARERTGQNESNVTQSEKSDKGDHNEGADEDKTGSGQNIINVNQTDGDAETEIEGSGGDNVKGQGDGDILKGIPHQKNATQTDKGQESGITGGGSSASISTRKRGRSNDPIHVGSSIGSGSNARKKGEMEVPNCAPTCYVCKKSFGSWKAVFGHLRAHRRQTPGAFPPPIFTPEGSPERNNKALKEQLAPTLLNLARETMQKMSQDSNSTVEGGVASSSSGRGTRGLDIDLNKPTTSFLLDLNDPPPPEKDDDDDKN